MQTETEDRWYVEVGGAPKMMTLDELVEAFEASTINSKTLVCEVGGSQWKPLSEVADLGDEEEAAPMSQQAPAVAGYVTPSKLPPAPAPRSVAPVPVGASSAFPAAAARQTLSAWPPPAANPSRPPALGSVPPMSAPSNSVVPPSTMPVVQDLSIPSDDEFKPRRSKAPFVMAAAVVLLVGGALGAAKFGGGGEVTAAVPVPAAAPPPVALPTETATSVAAATPPSTPAPTPSSDSTASSGDKDKEKASDSASETRLSDDTKSKLKEADKSRADKKKTAKASRGHAAARSKSSSSSSGVFRNGGSADDPLNSKL